MRSIIISPQQSLTGVVADILGTREDYSSCLVVFPGKRPAHFLRKTLSEQSGRCLIPPRIFSMDTFVDFMFEDILGLTARRMEAIDAVAVLFQIHKKYASPLGGSSFLNAASFLPLGLKLYNDLEELLLEGVTTDQVRRVDTMAGESLPAQGRERIQSLSFFYDEFYRETDRIGLTTRSQRYRAVATKSEEQSFSRFDLIVFAGFFAFTRTEQEIFRKLVLLRQSVSVFQDGPGIDTTLDRLGLSGGEIEDLRNAAGRRAAVEIKFYRSPDTHGQIFGLNGVLASEGARSSETGRDLIVLSSAEALFPLVHNCTALARGSSYNISLGYPLLRTPVYGFLRNLSEVVVRRDDERVHVPTYLSFILHPYTKNIYLEGRSDTTRVLFHGIETYLTERQKKFVSLEEIEESDELLNRLALQIEDQSGDSRALKEHIREIHDNTIRKFMGCRNMEDFAGKVIELIQYICGHSTARLHPFFHPFSESLAEHLAILKRSLLKDVAFHEMADYFNFLRRYASSCYVPFEGTPLEGLQVLGLLETRNLKFERVFILDANEDVISGVRKEDSLLPHSVRRALGLPDYRERTNLAAYYLDVLLEGCREAHLFYVENDRKERSRFVERLIWEKQKAEGEVEDEHLIRTVSYAINLENRAPAPIPKDSNILPFLKGFLFSATSLDRYLKCPVGFYYRYVLGLGIKEEVSDGIEAQELGNLVHTCLFEYFKERKGRRLVQYDMNTDDMQDIVERIFSQTYGEGISGSLYLVKRQVMKHLTDFLIRYQLPCVQQQDVAVLALEQKVAAEWNGFRLGGRIDRVERRNGETAIIDYKTGARSDRLAIRFDRLFGAAREKWPAFVGSLQLPFYLLVYSLYSGQPMDSVNPMFLMLGRSSITNSIEVPLFSVSDDRAECTKLLEHMMETLFSEIADADKPFQPTDWPAKFCTWCEFQSLCGTRWVKRRKA